MAISRNSGSFAGSWLFLPKLKVEIKNPGPVIILAPMVILDRIFGSCDPEVLVDQVSDLSSSEKAILFF